MRRSQYEKWKAWFNFEANLARLAVFFSITPYFDFDIELTNFENQKSNFLSNTTKLQCWISTNSLQHFGFNEQNCSYVCCEWHVISMKIWGRKNTILVSKNIRLKENKCTISLEMVLEKVFHLVCYSAGLDWSKPR